MGEKRVKFSYDFIKEKIEKEGYELLSTKYINAEEKLNIKCPLGHTYWASWNKFQQGRRCPQCKKINIGNQKRKNPDNIINKVKDMGYIFEGFIGGEYKNGKQYMTVVCPNNHKYNVRVNNFLRGDGCLECSGNKKLSGKYVVKEFTDRGLICYFDEDDYNNNKQKLPYKCPKHMEKIQYVNITSLRKNKYSCKYCRYENQSGDKCSSYNGGVSSLNNYLREQIDSWKRLSMKKYNYQCIITGEHMDVVHHLYAFHKIVEEVLENTGVDLYEEMNKYTDEQKNLLSKECLRLHFKYGLGITLTNEMHNLFHSVYDRFNNTPEQFEEFKTRLKQGEFNYFLEENDLKLVI